MEIKKSEITNILMTLLAFDDKGIPILGLLTEKLSLKTKRKLQTFRDALIEHYDKYQKDYSEILKEIEKDKNINLEEELNSLNLEIISLPDLDISKEEIEKIETSHNYDWKIIEKFTI